MDKRHRKAIRSNLVNLCTDLDFPCMEQHLIQEDIFPDGKLEAFKVIPVRSKQNVEFLNDIQRRGPNAFGALIRSLLSTNQEHCAAWLDPAGEIAQPASSIPPSHAPFRATASGSVQVSTGEKNQQPHGVDHSDQGPNVRPWENKETSYPINTYPRGIVLIINNEVFLDDQILPAREGTNHDCESIENLFRDLGFLVVKKQNLNLEEMKGLFEVYQKKDHSNYSCFVSVILSHGEHDGVCGTDYDKDKKEVLMMEDVVDVMDHCDSLAGKPKVFFTQACRGAKTHQPTTIQLDARRPEEDIARDLQNLKIKEEEAKKEPPIEQRTHVGSDVLMAFPTIKGYAAARERDCGTWFINSLCKVLKEHCTHEDLCSMMTMVNNKVGEKKGSLADGNVVTQTSEYKTTLKKKLYFPPVCKPHGVPPSS